MILTSTLRFALAIGLLSMWLSPLQAQQSGRCATDEKHAAFLAQHPEAEAYQAELEANLTRLRDDIQAQRAAGGGATYKIPVVFHIIQSSAAIDISDARLMSQLDVLNEDFRRLNADTTNIPQEFLGVSTDTDIEFCLATIDPNGCPTTGINRIVNPGLANHDQNAEYQLKSLIQWNPRMYLNVWVPENIPGLLGYATFPTSLAFAPEMDGVVINGQNIGRGNGIPPSTYDLGRTATHEVGHWLGLYHTFQGGCSGMNANNCSTGGDRCCDTPPTSNPVYGCPAVRNTCAESPVDQNDQTMNYMDYVDDRCMNMFTVDQTTRMHFYLTNTRSQLWSPANLAATGCDGTVSPGCVPVADFAASSQTVCVGQEITFTDLSTGPPTSWSWTFTGGTPATDTSASPMVSWSQPGLYTVSLTTQNGLGSDSETKNAYINVVEAASTPFVESFEGILFYPIGWSVVNPDQGITWALSTTAGSDGNNSMVIENYGQGALGSDELVSIPVDLSSLGEGTLTYDRAYRRYNGFTFDTLQVWCSADCGNTWTMEKEMTSFNLATVAGFLSNTAFEPTAAQWVTDTIDLAPYVGSSGFRIKFRNIGGGGQNIYIDRLNIDGLVGRAEAQSQLSLGMTLWPNPSQGDLHLDLDLPLSTDAEIGIYDLTGRVLWQGSMDRRAAGKASLVIPAAELAHLEAGAYLVRVQTRSGTTSAKWLRY